MNPQDTPSACDTPRVATTLLPMELKRGVRRGAQPLVLAGRDSTVANHSPLIGAVRVQLQPMSIGPMLPLAQPQPAARRDAARNRQLLIDAAQRLFAEHGVDAVSMDAVAQAAGVGKGTVFRRFGSRAGLLTALLNHDEIELQQSFMFGPPPLGPGGDPIERLNEYGKARMRLIARHGDLLLGAEQAARDPYDQPPWRVAVMTVRAMLADAGIESNTQVWAGALMATLSPGWVLSQLADGATPATLESVWLQHVRLVTSL